MSSASYGANFSQSANNNPAPTVFELLAQENLSSLFSPALQHVLKVLAQSRPDLFQKCYQYSDEIILGIYYLVEFYFLKTHDASFSENFYGLKRVHRRPDDQLPNILIRTAFNKLPNHVIQRSLLFLVLYPYIRRKLEKSYISSRDTQTNSWLSKLRKTFLTVYPYIHTTIEATLLIFQIGYTLGLLKRHSPFLSLSKVHLERLGADDLAKDSDNITWNSLLQLGLNMKTAKMFMKKSLTTSAMLFRNGLTMSMYFLQFLDWWNQSGLSFRSLTKLPTPDYPKNNLLKSLANNTSVFFLCPLCRQTRCNETALAVSGFVFCYKCIHEHVKLHGKCPITGYPCHLDHLVKIYTTDY